MDDSDGTAASRSYPRGPMETLLGKRSNDFGRVLRSGEARGVNVIGWRRSALRDAACADRQGGDIAMPFKSQAQRRKFAQLLVEGKISDQTFEEWNRETGSKKLPERVGSKSKASSKATSEPRRRTTKKK